MTLTFKLSRVLVPAVAAVLALAVAGCPAAPEPEPPALAPAPRIVAFTVNPTAVMEPGVVTLNWETANATEVKITDPARGEISGVDNKATGTLEVPVEGQTLFVLTARNERGVVDSATVAVVLESGVEQVQFFVSPTKLNLGETAVVAWTAPGARSVSLTANGQAVDLEGQSSSGSIELTPAATTQLVFVADDVTREAVLTVRSSLLDFDVSPDAARPGEPVTVSWRTSGATQIQIEEGSRGALTAPITEAGRVREGSFTEPMPSVTSPSQVFTYRIRVTTPEGELMQEQSVYVAGQPRVTSFAVPTYALTGGEVTLQWETVEAARVEIETGGAVIFQTADAARVTSGSLSLPTPAQATTYKITAFGARGGSASESGSTEPVGLPTGTFATSDDHLPVGGEPVELTWTLSSVKHLSVRAVNGMYVRVEDLPADTGSVTVYPNETTQYVLVGDNGVGDVVELDVTITVDQSVVASTSTPAPLVEGAPVGITFPGGATGAQMYGFQHSQVATRSASPNFIDIKQNGHILDPSDRNDSMTLVDVPAFATFLWGSLYEGKVGISTNGWLSFSPSVTEISADPPSSWPSTLTKHQGRIVAPFWTDLLMSPDSTIQWRVVGAAPDQMLVVQWNDMLHFDHATDTSFTFQAQISQSGVVRYVYKDMQYGGHTFELMIGTQNEARSDARSYGGAVVSGSEVAFFGAQSEPLMHVAKAGEVVPGFVKKGSGYLRVVYTSPQVLAPGDVVFSEVMYHPATSIETTGEYIEFWNRTAAPLDLHGFTVKMGTSSIVLDRTQGNTVAPAGGALLLAQSGALAENGGITDVVDYVYGAAFVMPNDAGTMSLEKDGVLASFTYAAGDVPTAGVSRTADPGKYVYAGSSTPKTEDCATPSSKQFGTLAQSGTPGVPSGCMGLTLAETTPDYWDIVSRGGTPLYTSGTGNSFVRVDLNGQFPFLDGVFDHVYVTAYGYVVFRKANEPVLTGATAYDLSYDNYPTAGSHDRSIAIFGQDTKRNLTVPESNVYFKHVSEGENPASPDEHWVFQWHKLQDYYSSDDLNYSLKLFKDGSFEFHYGTMQSNYAYYANGDYASVWVEDFDGSRAFAYSIQKPFLTQPSTPHSIRFEQH